MQSIVVSTLAVVLVSVEGRHRTRSTYAGLAADRRAEDDPYIQ